jgi:beta-mannosidase
LANFELSLNGSWKFKGFAECNGEELGAHKPEYDDGGWLPAKVPGTVHLDLLANNVIPDPFKGLNEKKVQWATENEWWYRREFDLPPDFLGKHAVELVFDGLDTFATVWVNSVKVGEADNMFTPWRFNISKSVKAGRNVIAVRFKPICKVALELEHKYGSKYGSLHAENFSARPYVRKAQYSFGWDLGPTLPTAGIWRSARVIAYDKAKLGYLAALPLQVSEDKAKIKTTAEVYAAEPCCVKAKFVVEGFGQRIEKQIIKQIAAGQRYLESEFEIAKPRLWWPRGYGAQNLYDVSVELYSDEVLCDKAGVKCGIRSVKLLQEPDDEGKSFIFRINGLPVFCKGANWIPADSFLPRVTADRYRKLLDLAAEANFNMLRVWGGGIYEDDAFYDLCDSLGIMVWQDFMYACSAYPEDDWFLKEAEREADEVVRRLRGHACIVVWCGNNEIQWQYQTLWKDMPRLFGLPIFDKMLPSVLSRLDGTRPYQPSSPYNGEENNSEHEGTRHNWTIWNKRVDYLAYLEDKGRFLTEFGWQAPPTLSLLREYLDDADMNIYSPAFEAHEKQVDGLKILRTLLSLHYPVPEDLKRFTLYAQLNQGEALKTAVTHWRSRMFKTSGCIIWQLNDCWPVISWSLVDYGLNAKAAYFFVKRAFQPVIAPLIIKESKAYVYVVNETEGALESTLKFQVMTFNGEVLYSQQAKTVTPAYTSKLALENALDTLPLKENCIFVVTLEGKGTLLYEDDKTVQEPENLKLPTPQVKIETKKLDAAKFEIMLESNVYAKAVFLKLDGVKGEFSDNFFDLIPKRPKLIKCLLERDANLEEFEEALLLKVYPYEEGLTLTS